MLPSLLPLLPGDPKPDAEIDVVFGFQLKVAYTTKYSDGLNIKAKYHCLF